MQQHARPARSDGVPAAKRSAGNESSIAEWKDKIVSVITNDGRRIIVRTRCIEAQYEDYGFFIFNFYFFVLVQGTLRGYDQLTNVILEKCHEHVYSPDTGVEIVPLGLYIIRGDNM